MGSKNKKIKLSENSESNKLVLDIINQKLDSMSENIEELREKVNSTQKENLENINKICDAVDKQNSNLVNILAEQTVAVKTVIESFWQTPKQVKLFPINTLEALVEWNESINETNYEDMIKAVTTVLGQKGLEKGLSLIIHQDILFHYNMDGLGGKKRFRNFESVLKVLCCSYTSMSMNQKEPPTFDCAMKNAFKSIKNRMHKDMSLLKKKQAQKENQNPIL